MSCFFITSGESTTDSLVRLIGTIAFDLKRDMNSLTMLRAVTSIFYHSKFLCRIVFLLFSINYFIIILEEQLDNLDII